MKKLTEGREYLKQIDWQSGKTRYAVLVIIANLLQLVYRWFPESEDAVWLERASRLTPLATVILLYLGIRYYHANQEVFSHASARFALKVYAFLLALPALGLIWFLGL